MSTSIQWAHVAMLFAPLLFSVSSCSDPVEVERVRTSRAALTGVEIRHRSQLSPNYARARSADEAVRHFEEARMRSASPGLPPPIPATTAIERVSEPADGCGGIPLQQLISEPERALAMGLAIVDLTFLDEGELDIHPLEPTGRYTHQTRRFRVLVNGSVRTAAGNAPTGEVNVYTNTRFIPRADAPGGRARYLAILSDQTIRPGLHFTIGIPLSADRGELRSAGFRGLAGEASRLVLQRLDPGFAGSEGTRRGT